MGQGTLMGWGTDNPPGGPLTVEQQKVRAARVRAEEAQDVMGRALATMREARATVMRVAGQDPDAETEVVASGCEGLYDDFTYDPKKEARDRIGVGAFLHFPVAQHSAGIVCRCTAVLATEQDWAAHLAIAVLP